MWAANSTCWPCIYQSNQRYVSLHLKKPSKLTKAYFLNSFPGFWLHAPYENVLFHLKSLFNWNCWRKKEKNAAYPCPSGSRLPAATGHVWRSPGMGEITRIPKNSRDCSQIWGRGVWPLTALREENHSSWYRDWSCVSNRLLYIPVIGPEVASICRGNVKKKQRCHCQTQVEG